MPEAPLGIIAFSAASSPLEDAEQVVVETPYGPTSAPIRLGKVDGVPGAFLARRGDEGQIPPQRIPYRANVWAMREVGVRRIVAPVVCGALALV